MSRSPPARALAGTLALLICLAGTAVGVRPKPTDVAAIDLFAALALLAALASTSTAMARPVVSRAAQRRDRHYRGCVARLWWAGAILIVTGIAATRQLHRSARRALAAAGPVPVAGDTPPT